VLEVLSQKGLSIRLDAFTGRLVSVGSALAATG